MSTLGDAPVAASGVVRAAFGDVVHERRGPSLVTSRARPTILLVDDDDELRGLIAGLLRDEGYHTLCARTGAEAAAHARSSRPSLVLLDYRLGDESGSHVARSLRAECGSALPIVLASGCNELPAHARELKAVGMLYKPFGIDELLSCLRRHAV